MIIAGRPWIQTLKMAWDVGCVLNAEFCRWNVWGKVVILQESELDAVLWTQEAIRGGRRWWRACPGPRN